jgi:hypothetical protein
MHPKSFVSNFWGALQKLKRGFIVLLKPNPETYLKFHALRQKVFKIFPKDSSLLKAYISVKAR